MGDLASTCKDKLAYFRIKELKDVLTQLRLPKQGKKQELTDRVLALLSDEQGPGYHGWGKKSLLSKEVVAKIIDDTYRKIQVHGAPEVASRSHSGSDFNVRPKEEANDSYPFETKIRCLCGTTFPADNYIKCEDSRCHVWQHMRCVLIPEQPLEGVAAEVPSQFYCELCRLSWADPFLVTTGNPLPPVKFTSSGVANDGTNVLPNVEKTFQLSRAERETVQRGEYDIQVWCMLLNDKVQFRMQWPQYADIQVNGIPLRVVSRPGSQLLGINGRDDGLVITNYCREGINKICLSRVDTRTFCFGIRIARKRTVHQVLNMVPKDSDGECFEDALARVRRCLGGGNATENADSDSDLEVVADSVTVSLRCPNSGSRIRIAGRFKPCVHMGCFDLETFVELNQRSRKWQCPICLKNYSLENLIVDPYFNRITSLLRNSSEDVNEIDVKPDGSWRVKGDVETKELSHWHMPDGSLCNSKEGAKTVVNNVNQFKKEGTSDGHRSLKIGMKRNSNGIWEVSSKADGKMPSMVGNHIQNNRECHFPNIVSSSPTGSYRDGEDPSVNQEGSMRIDLSLNNGHEFDSFTHSFSQRYDIENRLQQQHEEADVIVLTDSDEENVAMVSPPAAYHNTTANAGGFPFAASTSGFTDRYQEDAGVGTSGHCLFNNNGGDFEIDPWPMPSCTQPEQGFQFFGTDADVANTFVDSHNSFGIAPNGYSLDCNAVMGEPSMVQDLSTCHTGTELLGSLVDNPLPFGSDDPSLQIFLPSRPSAVPVQSELTEHANRPNDVHSDDWISLTLAAGGGGNEVCAPTDALNSQLQIPPTETRMGPWSDADPPLLSMNDDRHSTANLNPRIENIFSHPRQPRSVRPRLRLSMDTDSE